MPCQEVSKLFDSLVDFDLFPYRDMVTEQELALFRDFELKALRTFDCELMNFSS